MAYIMGKQRKQILKVEWQHPKVVFGPYEILCIIVSNVCEVPMILICSTCQSYQWKPEYELVVHSIS